MLLQASKQASKQGIPIGNLTSQIFANIYLNELDRFVRHNLKPQAYVRYGDDFVLFCPTRRVAHQFRHLTIDFLDTELGLTVNPKSDIIVAAKDGLHFLGHRLGMNSVIVDPVTTRRVFEKLDWHNAASYRALYLDPETRKQLDWALLDKSVDT